MTKANPAIPARPGPGRYWFSSLFFKCFLGVTIIFALSSLVFFTIIGIMEKRGLSREISAQALTARMATGLASIDQRILFQRAAAPYCQDSLGVLLPDLLGHDNRLWMRYNRSMVFDKTMQLVLRYRADEVFCQYALVPHSDLLKAAEETEERVIAGQSRVAEIEMEPSNDGHWLTVASMALDEPPGAVLTLGIRVNHGFRSMLFPGLRALGHLAIHLSLISFISSLLLAFYVVRRIKKAQRTAAEWAAGNLQARINDPSRDEFGRLSLAFDDMADALGKSIEIKQSLAASEERNRMAQDLHDTAKQRCFVLGLRLSLLARICDPANKKETELIQSALDLTKMLQNDLADIINSFSWPTIAQAGLHRALTQSLDLLLRDGEMEWSLNLEEHEAAFLETEPYHAWQLLLITTEAAANTLRHSQADRLTVSYEHLGNRGYWLITDNGRGFDPTEVLGNGMGLANIKHRAESLPNGRLIIEAAPDRGTRLIIEFDVV